MDILPEEVSHVLRERKLPGSGLSVYVREIGAAQPLISYNADTPRNPASVMKAVTTLVALQIMGPGYHWYTDVYVDGLIENGRLEGNLYLKGGGDPFLVTESFWRMLRQLRDRGVRSIAGDLVVDNGGFAAKLGDPGGFDGQRYRAYNTFPRALLVNFQANMFNFWPDEQGDTVTVSVEPPHALLNVRNDVKLVKTRCRGLKRRIKVEVTHEGGMDAVRFSGDYPLACGPYSLLRAISKTPRYEMGVFSALWGELGGKIDGRARVAPVPLGARQLFRWQSRSLSDVIRAMNKYSNNVMTRQLLLSLGRKRYGGSATLTKGREAVVEWMRANGVDTTGFFIENGSGLSRRARITARSLVQLLEVGHRSSLMPEFVSSLPLSGVDGTLRRRFKKSPLVAQVHMKTGLIRDVRAISGYVQSASGRQFAVAILHNRKGVQGGDGDRVQDAVIKWVYAQ